MTPDVNVLVAASRMDHPHHKVARMWLEQALEDAGRGVPFTLQPMVISSFLRLVTHPRIFLQPTPTSSALDFIDAILAAPNVGLPSLGPEWNRLRELCAKKGLAANDVPDAWLAAAVTQQGEHLVTFDGDFKRLLSRSEYTRLKASA